VRRRITIILCVAMLLQLSIGAALGLAEDAGDSMAQPELVSIMAATLSPGNVVGTTSATITGHVYGSLVVNITEAEIVTPYVGDPPPTAGDNLITGYESGADINAGVAAGNCLQVYAVDMEDQARIVGFYQAELTEADIKEVDMEEVPVEDRMMLDMAPMSGEPVIITTDNGAINNDGIYKLSADFTGEISIGTAATSVTIIGNGFGTQHIDTYINVASGRSSALTLTIVDLNIQAPVDKPGIDFSSAGNYAHVLDISGSSKAAGDTDYAGIQVPAGVSLTITSTSNGSLEAVGGQNGAGIGGGKNGPGGNITISGGIVTAQGGSGSYLSYGAGIGGGGSESGIGGSGGTITISGGTVTAQGQYAAGVGGGGSQSEGQGGSGGAITITNYPTVIASNGGSTGLADIGNGYKANLAGTTTIKNGSGTDLTYIRLQVGNLSSATGNKITVNGQEYEINNAGRTGFFVDKPTSSLDITLNLAGYDPVTINSNPGDVQNQKIYMNYGINIKYEAATGGTVSRASETPASITGVAQGSTATANEGCSLKNWTKDGAVVGTATNFIPAKVDGLNVAATYTANFIENYTITYNLDGGDNGANPASYNAETPTITLNNATKTGYKFTGWFNALTGGTQVMEIANGSTGNKTLYARWTEIDYTTDYEIIGDPTHYTLSENVLTIGTGANGNTITVKGTMNGSTLAIADGVTNLTLKLNGVEITSTSKSPIDLQGNSKVTVEVAGGTTNILDASGAANKAGLHVPVNASLTITGTGSLEVTGGNTAAGIGSGDLAVRSGTITINDGTITSTGGAGGAGIGGGKNSSSGAITINGGTVTATAPIGAAGIGGGNSSESTYITITGGTVIAMGTTGSAAIGGGWQANGGTIIITGGTINAIGGNGIGSGYQSTTGSKITIDQSADVTIVSDFNNFAINGDSTGMVINAKLDAAISTSERFLEMDSRILRLPASTKCFAFSAATASKIFVYSDKLCLNLIGRIVTDSGQPEIPVTNLGVDPTNVTPVKFQTLLSDSNVVISAVNPSYEYIGSPLIPEPTVIFGYTTLVKDTDYTLNYSDNSNMGTAKITITFIGKYYGTVEKTFTITRANLTATVEDYSRSYGEANPEFVVTVTGFKNGETASTASGYNAPTASTTATAATGVGTAEISISGGAATNYIFNTADTGTLTITPKALTAIAVADNKTYDGTAAASGTINLTGIVGADDVMASGSFSFADADAGNGKTVHVTGITLAGTAAGNYRVDASTTTTADITPKILTPTARADDKVHDGTTSASGTITFSGIIGSGDVFASGTFAFEDAQVGTDKVVNVTGISLGGAQAGNYSLSTTTVTATADITKSTNADLSGLLVSGGLILSPAFSAAETNYSGNVSHNTSSIVITPTTAHSAATIRINGDIMTGASSTVLLNVGNNTIIIEVTAQDGVTKKTYSLNIIRGNASSNNSSGGSSGDITSSTSATPAQPDNNGIDILVNGKTETAATATTSQEGDRTVTNVIVDDNKVEERLEQGGNHAVVTIPVNNGADVVIGTLNGQTVKNMEMTESVLKITTDQVTYTLPASQINIDAVSQQIGREVELKDIAVSVRISEPPAETVKIVADTANQNNYQIVVPPIEFAITCSSGNKTVGVTKFNAYVERLVAIPEGIDPSRITTGVIVNSEGTFSHVPTVITVIDGKYYAKINSLTNSTYSVIYSPKVFKDVETHWARDAINDMASRLVVSGVGQDTFEPGRDITRAEFAAIVVRGLGLMRPGVGQDNFDDVIQKNWYYDAVTIAGENGIISGYGYGKFGPDDQITREQAMAMIARAMQVTKLEANLTDSETNKVLAGFTDANRAADYAKPGIAACVKTGLISGRNPNTLAPKDNITRAEVAVIVQRLLQRSGLI